MSARRLPGVKAAIMCCVLLTSCSPAQDGGPVVLAAASMQEGLSAAADSWATTHGQPPPILSFASSAAVARQVDEGAPADLVVIADDRWIDWLVSRDVLAGTPVSLVSNALVVVAPLGVETPESLVAFANDKDAGRLAIAEPSSVPAGHFAKAALQTMGLWDALSTRLAPGDNVRASLALVERGEATMGIVYASDAAASDRVQVVEQIAPEMHPPIIYYAARVSGAQHESAQDFLDYLTSPQGRQIIVERGFTLP